MPVYRTSHHVLFRQPTATAVCPSYSRHTGEPENYHADGDNDTGYLYLTVPGRQCAFTLNNHDVARRAKARQHQTGKGAKALRGKAS